MIQEIIVAIVGLLIVALVAYKVYGFFFSKKGANSTCGCSHCSCSPSRKVK